MKTLFKFISLILVVLLLSSCGGGGGGAGGGTAAPIPIMSTPTIPDGSYRLISVTSKYNGVTTTPALTGTLTSVLTWKGNGIYQRVYTGNVTATWPASNVETIDCNTTNDVVKMQLNANGWVVAVEDVQVGCGNSYYIGSTGTNLFI